MGQWDTLNLVILLSHFLLSCLSYILSTCIFHLRGGGVWVYLLGDQGAGARVILVLRECIWNAPAVLLVHPAFDDTGSWVLLCVRWSIPLFEWFHPDDWLPFPCGEYGG